MNLFVPQYIFLAPQRQVTEDKTTQLNQLDSGKDETTQTVGLRKPVILHYQLDKYAYEIYKCYPSVPQRMKHHLFLSVLCCIWHQLTLIRELGCTFRLI